MAPRDRTSRSGGTLDQQRLLKRVEDLVGTVAERMEALVDRLDGRMTRIEQDVAKGALEQQALVRELNESRVDQGELRDLVSMLKTEVENARELPVEAAARGAAKGAVQAGPARGFWGDWRGWIVAAAAGLAGLKAAIDGAPSVLAFLEGLWRLLRHGGES